MSNWFQSNNKVIKKLGIGAFRTWGSHPKMQIYKLGLLVYRTGASVWNFINIRVEMAEIWDKIKMAPLIHGVVTPNCK